jgi:hypothetical protein
MFDFLFGQWAVEHLTERIHAARRVGPKQRFGEHECVNELMSDKVGIEVADGTVVIFPRPYFLELNAGSARRTFVLAALEDASAHG